MNFCSIHAQYYRLDSFCVYCGPPATITTSNFPAGPILPTTALPREHSTPSIVYDASANGGVEQVGPSWEQHAAAQVPVDGHTPGPGGMYRTGFMDSWQ